MKRCKSIVTGAFFTVLFISLGQLGIFAACAPKADESQLVAAGKEETGGEEEGGGEEGTGEDETSEEEGDEEQTTCTSDDECIFPERCILQIGVCEELCTNIDCDSLSTCDPYGGYCRHRSCETDDDCDGELCAPDFNRCVFRCDYFGETDECFEKTGDEDAFCLEEGYCQ